MKKKPTKAQITRGALHEKQAIDFLRDRLGEKGQIVLPQVRNGTGHTYRIRTADALIVETWASRGIGFTGVEYKRSRADWLSELKAPAKAEEIGKYCKYWVVLAPAGLIDVDEVPELWGLWEIHDNAKIKVKKRAPLRKYRDPTTEFVCSILRANHDYDPSYGHDWAKEQAMRTRIEGEFEHRIERISSERDKIQASVREFESRTGLSMLWGVDGSIEDAKAMLNYLRQPDQFTKRINRQRAELKAMLDSIDKIMEKINDRNKQASD